eukprot:gene979-574_t
MATPSAIVGVSTAAPAPMARPEREILVIYAGGTIGMKRNHLGALEPKKGYLTEKMKTMSELRESSLMARFDILEYDPLLDSSDMNSVDYLKIARDVEKHYERYDGFLIAIGTDTMHYAAAALSFLLYNLSKPVIVTGAMVPLAMPFNDARRNLIIGMMLASHPAICEVCIFFNDSLFRGNRCDKVLHTFAAFQSLGYPALGVITGKNFVVRKQLLLRQPTGRIRILSDMKARVIAFRINPEADVDTLVKIVSSPHEQVVEGGKGDGERQCRHPGFVNGVVLVLHGVGSLEDCQSRILHRIAEAAQKMDVVICVTTPDIRKTLSATAVSRLKHIAPAFVYLYDMCLSTAETKLMYLFGKGLSSQEVARNMLLNIRGEISPPSRSTSQL